MSEQRKKPLGSKKMRLALIGWFGITFVATVVTFVVILIAVDKKNNPADEVGEGQSLATSTPYVLPTLPVVTPIGGDQETPESFPPPATFGLLPTLETGGQVPGYIANAPVMHEAGMTWVKFQIKWNTSTNPEDARVHIEDAHGKGLKILLSITGDPYPQSIDFEAYTAYLGEVAAFKPDAIEIWNEMNLNREWPSGQIDPEAYVQDMLAPAYNIIKATSPDTAVIIGALAPTGVHDGVNVWSDDVYVSGLGMAGAAGYADCIGVHHNSGTTSPSVRSGRPEGDHYSWYYLPTIEVYYNGLNGALPVCVTEFGYLSPEGITEPLPGTFSWGANTSLAEQAAWLAEGVDLAQQLGYIPLLIVWNVDFPNWGDDDPFKGYAILRADGTCPACASLRVSLEN